MLSLLLKDLMFYLPSLQLVSCSVAAVKRILVHQPYYAVYILFLVLWDKREYSEKSEINDWFRPIF